MRKDYNSPKNIPPNRKAPNIVQASSKSTRGGSNTTNRFYLSFRLSVLLCLHCKTKKVTVSFTPPIQVSTPMISFLYEVSTCEHACEYYVFMWKTVVSGWVVVVSGESVSFLLNNVRLLRRSAITCIARVLTRELRVCESSCRVHRGGVKALFPYGVRR